MDEPNPGHGDTRFAPFDDLRTGTRVPTMYLGATRIAALLETVFHDVHHQAARVIYDAQLNPMILAHLRTPKDLQLVDLRDAELHRLGLPRNGLAATTSEHYPCTRRWAQALHGEGAQGIVWHSRQAELLDRDSQEVMVTFCDRYAVQRGGWQLTTPGLLTLYEGRGRDLVDEAASELSAVVDTGK